MKIAGAQSIDDNFSSQSIQYYDQIFADDRLDITIALGFEQQTYSGDLPVIGPVLGPLAQIYESAKLDIENTLRDVRLLETKLFRCEECNFQRVTYKKGEQVFESQFSYEGRQIETRVRFIYALPGVKLAALKKAFIAGLKNDDVIIYLGHARDGRGFPDFSSPLSETGLVFTNDTFGGWLGFDKGYFHPTKYQILVVHACHTDQYFSQVIRERVWEKDPDKLGLIMTRPLSWFEDYPPTTIALIRALMLQRSRDEIMSDLEKAAIFYREKHRADEVKEPLFTANGFFDETFKGVRRPKKKIPRESWREMPF